MLNSLLTQEYDLPIILSGSRVCVTPTVVDVRQFCIIRCHFFNCLHWDLYKIYDLHYLRSSRTATLRYRRCLFTHHIFVWFSSAQTTARWLILVKMLPPLHFAHKIFRSKHRTILVDGSLESWNILLSPPVVTVAECFLWQVLWPKMWSLKFTCKRYVCQLSSL